MADPVTATMAVSATLGLVCNILQVSEYAYNLVSQSLEIRNSIDGATKKSRDAATCAHELLLRNQKLVDSLQKEALKISNANQDEDDIAMEQLGQQCCVAARQLIERLSSLRGQRGSGKSVMKALKLLFSKDELLAMEAQMQKFQREINSRLLQSLSFRQRLLGSAQAEGFDQLQRGDQEILRTLKDNQTTVVTDMSAVKDLQLQILTILASGAITLPTYSEKETLPQENEVSIHEIVGNGDKRGLVLLLDSKPGVVQARDDQGRTPLHLAAQGRDMLINPLLHGGAHIDAEDDLSATPLHVAVKDNNALCVRRLVALGANLDAMDDNSMKPLDYAVEGSEVAWILKFGPVMDARNEKNETALYHYAQKNDQKTIQSLLKQGASRGLAKDDALFVAAHRGHKDIVALLLAAGANVNATGFNKNTPLAVAAMSGHIDVVKQLLRQKGVKINCRNQWNWTPLSEACEHEFPEIAIMLLNAGANPEMACNGGDRALQKACRRGLKQVVIEIVQRFEGSIHWRGAHERTALLEACRKGRTDIVELLLSHDADSDMVDQEMMAPIDFAVQNGYGEIVDLLLGKGKVDINARNSKGWTPLVQAIQSAHIDVIRILLSRGADANKPELTGQRRQPLEFTLEALDSEAIAMIRLLVQEGNADIDARANKIGETILIRAIRQRRASIVAELLALGADTNVRCLSPVVSGGRCYYPINIAAIETPNLVEMLVDQGGADVNAQNNDGWTALHEAAANNHMKAVRVLLERGAKRDIQNNAKLTPAQLAAKHKKDNWADVVELLRDYWPCKEFG